MFFIGDDFLQHFIELLVPGNGKLGVAVGVFAIFVVILSNKCRQLYSFREQLVNNPTSKYYGSSLLK